MKPIHLTLPLLLALAARTLADTPLPSSLGTLTNPADQSISFGAPSTTAALTMNDASSLTNLGTWTAYTGTIAPPTSPPNSYSASILNTGTLNIDAGTGTFTIQDFPTTLSPVGDPAPSPLTFTTTGTINLLSGSFNLAASDTGDSSGTLTLSTGTTLGLAANLTFDSNSSITGAGNVLISTNLRMDPTYGYVPTTTNAEPAVIFNGGYSATGTTTIYATAVAFNTNATVNNLQVSGPASGDNPNYIPALAGSGTLTITGTGSFHGPVSWIGGPTISGAVISLHSLVVAGTLNLTTVSDVKTTVDGTAITVQSAGLASIVAPGNSAFYFQNHATLVNNNVMFANATFLATDGTATNHSVAFTNNGTLYITGHLTMDRFTEFNNNGTVIAAGQSFEPSPYGTDSDTSVINIKPGVFLFDGEGRSFLHGTLNSAGVIAVSSGTSTFGASLTLISSGSLDISGASTLILQAAQQPATAGIFDVAGGPPILVPGTLEFAANYDFSSPTGPSLTGAGNIIIDPGITLTLPSDTPFSGTILDNGTLILAPALNSANAGLAPNFTVLPTPEPASLSLLAVTAPLLLRRPRKTSAAQ